MSQSEEQQSSRPPSRGDEEPDNQEEDEAPLVALAPDASLPDEQPSNPVVSKEKLFQSIDEMLSAGTISMTQAIKLRDHSRRLYDTLKRKQESVSRLSEEERRLQAELSRTQAVVESSEEQMCSDTEIDRQRLQLFHDYQKLSDARERCFETEFQLECLQEEKDELERKSKPVELKIRERALKDKHEDLMIDVAQLRLKVSSLQEQLETREMRIREGQKELEDIKKITEITEAELAQFPRVREQLVREIQELSRTNADLARKLEASESAQQLRVYEEQNRALQEEKKEMVKKIVECSDQMDAIGSVNSQLLKDNENKREEIIALMGKKGLLDMKLRDVIADRKLLYETKSRQLKQIQRDTEALKKMESVSEEKEHLQSIYNELKAQKDAYTSELEAVRQKRTELLKETDTPKTSIKTQHLPAVDETMEKHNRDQLELQNKLKTLREEVHQLSCLGQVRAAEALQAQKELHRTQKMHQCNQEELQQKHLEITENKKCLNMIQNRLSKWTKACDMIIEDRDRYVKLHQAVSEKAAMLTCDLELQSNVLKDLQATAIKEERLLAKGRGKLSCSRKEYDRLCDNIYKARRELLQLHEQAEDCELKSSKLTKLIEEKQQANLQLTKATEAAAQKHDYLRGQLLKREEEVLILRKDVSVVEGRVTDCQLQLDGWDAEKRRLRVLLREAHRQNDLRRKEQATVRSMEEEVAVLRTELKEARNKRPEAEQALNMRQNPVLKRPVPTNAELVEKEDTLRAQLAECERQLYESELLRNQMDSLIQPLRQQVENSRQETLEQAKKVNELKADIRQVDRCYKARIAEVTMWRAEASALERQKEELQQKVDLYQQRMEEGLPPCPEIEEERKRALQVKKWKQRDKEEKERLAEEMENRRLPQGGYTTAEPRPDAYIPQDDSLLPRPYGAQAPVKPAEPGANMRHIRKPRPRP